MKIWGITRWAMRNCQCSRHRCRRDREHQEGVVIDRINQRPAHLQSSIWIHWEDSWNTGSWAPPSEFLIQWFWGGACESAFLTDSQVMQRLQVQDHTLRTAGLETAHLGECPTWGAFTVTPVTASVEGEGSWGRRVGDPLRGTSKINTAGGVLGDREMQAALKNRIFLNLILKVT